MFQLAKASHKNDAVEARRTKRFLLISTENESNCDQCCPEAPRNEKTSGFLHRCKFAWATAQPARSPESTKRLFWKKGKGDDGMLLMYTVILQTNIHRAEPSPVC